MSFQPRKASRDAATKPASLPRLKALRSREHGLWAALFSTVFLFSACGVQAPPKPPRLETPATIKDLKVLQVGRTLHLTFTMPTLATDGERLDKPVEVRILRSLAPPGQTAQPPAADATPWATLRPGYLKRYLRGPEIFYSAEFPLQQFRAQQGYTFAFSVVTLTRGFRHHPHTSEPSNVARAKLVDVTEPPANLVIRASQHAILLRWGRPARTLTGAPPLHLKGYRIYVSETGKPDSFRRFAEVSGSHYADSSFQFGRRYFFKVSAVSALGASEAESEPSGTVPITPRDVFPPAVPSGLAAVYTAGAVDLLWNADLDADLAGYNVYRKSGGGQFARLNRQLAPTPIYHDAFVAPDRSYEYAVTAVDLSGNESSMSKPSSVTTTIAK